MRSIRSRTTLLTPRLAPLAAALALMALATGLAGCGTDSGPTAPGSVTPAAGGNGSGTDSTSGTSFGGPVTSIDRSTQTLVMDGGTQVAVDSSTLWDPSGDLTSFAAVADAFDAGQEVEVEGTGTLNVDGSMTASSIKAEVDGSGGPMTLQIKPDAWHSEWANPRRDSMRVEARITGGAFASIDAGSVSMQGPGGSISPLATTLLNKRFTAEFSKPQAFGLVAGLGDGDQATITVSGQLTDGSTFSVTATIEVRVRVEEAEFESRVAAADRAAQTLLLANGQTVGVDSSTVWKSHGDLHSFTEVADAVDGGQDVEVEGKGVVQPDGSILAAYIKAEVRVEEAEFESRVTAADRGTQTLMLASGQSVVIDSATEWKSHGDLHSFTEVADAVDGGQDVRVHGKGTVQPDGSILADHIKAEVRVEEAEFESRVTAADRATQTLMLASGQRVVTDGSTEWKSHGDLHSFIEVADAVDAGQQVEVEGHGVVQPDGSILASWIKAEVEVEEAEFESKVASADRATQTLTLTDGQVVVISAGTLWKSHGDLHSFTEVADAVDAGQHVEVEGTGTVQADGSILAAWIKAEMEIEEAEFESKVTAVDRAAQTLMLASGQTVVTDAETLWKSYGDLHSFTEVADAVDAGQDVRAYGKGVVQPDGSILASWIKARVEVEEAEFESRVTAADRATQTLMLASGQSVITDGETLWKSYGDLYSFTEVADAVDAGQQVEVEGHGVVQPDGSILASWVKAELDE